MIATLQFIATLSAALFTGAALYINVAEHPARMLLDTRSAALQWAPSYKRATWLQAPLALISLACGTGAWVMGGSVYWVVGAGLVGCVVPYTFAVIMKTNNRLMDPNRDLSSLDTRTLLSHWAGLHTVRTALSLAGTSVYLWQLVWA